MALSGGYHAGDVVFYTRGTQKHTESGDTRVFGRKGEVTGPGSKEGQVAVMFPWNKGNVDCLTSRLSLKAPPAIAGGFRVGDKVLYTGDDPRVGHGSEGVVTGATAHPVRQRAALVQLPLVLSPQDVR